MQMVVDERIVPFIAGDGDEVADDGIAGRQCTGSLAVQLQFSQRGADQRRQIEVIRHIGFQGISGDECRDHCDRITVLFLAGLHHEADAAAVLQECLQVSFLQVPDPADRKVAGADGIEGERGRDHRLVGGIDPVDVRAGICFCVPGRLRLCQRCFKIQVFFHHLIDDVVGRAVEDAADGTDRIDALCLQQGTDPWDAAGTAGLKAKLYLVLPCRFQKFLQVSGDDRLVGGDDMLALAQGL